MKLTGTTRVKSNNIVLAVTLALPVVLVACDGGLPVSQERVGESLNTISTSTVQTAPLAAVNNDKVIDNPAKTSEVSTQTSTVLPHYLDPNTLTLSSPVNDFTDTLTVLERKALNKKIQAIYSEGLLQIGIVMVDTTGDMAIFDYAMTIAQRWALGSEEYSNGVVIVVAKNDRKLHILTGSDIDDKLTDERVAEIIDKKITPYFPKGQYAQGLSAGINTLAEDMRRYQKK